MTWRTLSIPQRIEAIKAVWEPGTSARIMAAQLGTTRNAIIGTFGRHGPELAPCHLRGKQARMKAHASAKRAEKVVRLATSKPLPAFTPAEYDATALNLTLLDLGRHQCRWPMNDGGPFLFCGHATEDGPYCAHHAARAVGRGTEAERSAHRARAA